jgi:hypothetical protein
MKNFLFLFALFIVTIRPAHAQFGYGPEVGIGMSSMHFAPTTAPILYTSASTSPIFSGKVGGLIDLPLQTHIYFQAGLSLSRRGAVRSFSYYIDSSYNESVHQTLHINYLDLPVNVLYKSGMQGKWRFIAGLGATASYIIGGRNILLDSLMNSGVPTNTNDNLKISLGNTIKGFDIGVNISAGCELPTGLFFRAYYTAGVSDIGVGTEVDKTRIWGIAAGYFFGKGRNINKEADELIDKTDLIDKTKD